MIVCNIDCITSDEITSNIQHSRKWLVTNKHTVIVDKIYYYAEIYYTMFYRKRRIKIMPKLIRKLRIFVYIKLHVCQQGCCSILLALFKPLSLFFRHSFSCQLLSTSLVFNSNGTYKSRIAQHFKKNHHTIFKNMICTSKITQIHNLF